MDHLTHIRRLYEFEAWATARVLDSLYALDNPPQLALDQLGHSLAARLAWLTRLVEGHSDDVEVWPQLTLDSIGELHRETQAALGALLDGLDDAKLAERFSYRSYDGDSYSDTLADILVHVVNHASHHRGIILRAIREARGSAPACDWIVFTRG